MPRRYPVRPEDRERLSRRLSDLRHALAEANASDRNTVFSNPNVVQAAQNLRSAIRLADRHRRRAPPQGFVAERAPFSFYDEGNRMLGNPGYYGRRHWHSDAHHHIGPCDRACREGVRLHFHRRVMRS